MKMVRLFQHSISHLRPLLLLQTTVTLRLLSPTLLEDSMTSRRLQEIFWIPLVLKAASKVTGLGLLLVGLFAYGQIPTAYLETHPARGIYPTGTYDASSVGVVNAVSGNLTYQLPLASLPPGPGGSAGMSVGLAYNSTIYTLTYGPV